LSYIAQLCNQQHSLVSVPDYTCECSHAAVDAVHVLADQVQTLVTCHAWQSNAADSAAQLLVVLSAQHCQVVAYSGLFMCNFAAQTHNTENAAVQVSPANVRMLLLRP
jgi:hypothetical protein